MSYMKDLIGRRLDSFVVRSRTEHRFPSQLAILSDSLWSYGENIGAYVEVLSGQKHRFTSPLGTNRLKSYPGQTAATVLSHLSEVTAWTGLDRPTHCIVQGGTNDMIASTSPSVVLATLEAGYAALEVAGITPIMSTIPPVGGSFGSSSARSPGQRLNVLLRDSAMRNGRILIDPYAALIDMSTGSYQATYDSGDNVHPNPNGIKAWAAKVISDLAAIGSAPTLEHLTFGNNSDDLFIGGRFTAGGGIWGAGTSAGLSSQLGASTAQTGFTPSLVSVNSGQYFTQRFTTSGASANQSIFQNTEFTLIPGHRYRAAIGYASAQDAGGSFRTQAYIRCHAGATEVQNVQMSGPLGISRAITNGILMAEFTAPVGATTGQLNLIIPPTTGTYDFSRPRIHDLTALLA